MKTATVLAESPDYRPSEDEEFMNERQLEYFKQKLTAGKRTSSANLARRCPISRRKPRIIRIWRSGVVGD
jgi:hypothetical protein